MIDSIGILLFVSSTSSFLTPFSWGRIMYGWDSVHTLTPLALGVAGDPELAGFADRYSHDAFAVIELLPSMPGALALQLRSAYVYGLQTVWAVCCAIAGVTLFLSLFIKAYRVK
jgi:hypothetical protein